MQGPEIREISPVDIPGIPGGIFLTSNMHEIHFRPGLRPGPRCGSLRRFPGPLVGC